MMHHPVRCFLIDQGNMHSILPSKRRRQRIPVHRKLYAALAGTFGIFAHTPGLVTLAAAVGACVRCVEQKPDLAAAGCCIDFLGTQDKVPCPCFQAQPVKKSLFQPAVNASGKVIDDLDFVRFESTAQQSGQFALGLSLGQFGVVDTDPRATTGGLGEEIRRHTAVRTEREPDERGAFAMLTR
jgi:hypothetical protein